MVIREIPTGGGHFTGCAVYNQVSTKLIISKTSFTKGPLINYVVIRGGSGLVFVLQHATWYKIKENNKIREREVVNFGSNLRYLIYG